MQGMNGAIGVVGGGIMGSGIAEVAARAGFDVIVRECDELTVQAAQRRLNSSLARAVRAGKLSARGYQRVRAVALTIADLGAADCVGREHLAEALQLRSPLLETVFAEVGNGY